MDTTPTPLNEGGSISNLNTTQQSLLRIFGIVSLCILAVIYLISFTPISSYLLLSGIPVSIFIAAPTIPILLLFAFFVPNLLFFKKLILRPMEGIFNVSITALIVLFVAIYFLPPQYQNLMSSPSGTDLILFYVVPSVAAVILGFLTLLDLSPLKRLLSGLGVGILVTPYIGERVVFVYHYLSNYFFRIFGWGNSDVLSSGSFGLLDILLLLILGITLLLHFKNLKIQSLILNGIFVIFTLAYLYTPLSAQLDIKTSREVQAEEFNSQVNTAMDNFLVNGSICSVGGKDNEFSEINQQLADQRNGGLLPEKRIQAATQLKTIIETAIDSTQKRVTSLKETNFDNLHVLADKLPRARDKNIANQIIKKLEEISQKMPAYTEGCTPLFNGYLDRLQYDFQLGRGEINYQQYTSLAKESNKKLFDTYSIVGQTGTNQSSLIYKEQEIYELEYQLSQYSDS